MQTCPECGIKLKLDKSEVKEGNVLGCSGCGTEFEIWSIKPLMVMPVCDRDDEDESDPLIEENDGKDMAADSRKHIEVFQMVLIVGAFVCGLGFPMLLIYWVTKIDIFWEFPLNIVGLLICIFSAIMIPRLPLMILAKLPLIFPVIFGTPLKRH